MTPAVHEHPVSTKTESLMEATARLCRIVRLLEGCYEIDSAIEVRAVANRIATRAAERRQMDLGKGEET